MEYKRGILKDFVELHLKPSPEMLEEQKKAGYKTLLSLTTATSSFLYLNVTTLIMPIIIYLQVKSSGSGMKPSLPWWRILLT